MVQYHKRDTGLFEQHPGTSITADRYAHLLDHKEEAILKVLSEANADPTRADTQETIGRAA